jgi:hypothetical protein
MVRALSLFSLGASSDVLLEGNQRLVHAPVEWIRQATTKPALGSARHVYADSSKVSMKAQMMPSLSIPAMLVTSVKTET